MTEHIRFGAVFPQTDLRLEPSEVRAYVTGVEGLGLRHLFVYDHVLGADPAVHRPWTGPYDITHQFLEPLTLFGYVGALTGLECVTGVMVLPQRQTALVAKQTATLDLLCAGGLRLGVGVGWNPVEYNALGVPFGQRGKRLDAQIQALRRLWADDSVNVRVGTEEIVAAGLRPRPRQGRIPIWIGGRSHAAYVRVGRFGDGWFPQVQPGPELDEARSVVHTAAAEAGRDPASIGMEARLAWRNDLAAILSQVDEWRAAGATHISFNTMGCGLRSASEHLGVLERIARELLR